MSSELINYELDEALDELLQSALSSSDSDDDNRTHGGFIANRSRNLDRSREQGYTQLLRDYLCINPVYHDGHFRRRFRLYKRIYYSVCNTLQQRYEYFQTRIDCTGTVGFRAEQKVAAALRLLAYGSATDSVDEYIRMAESTASDCLKRFCKAVVETFKEQYLRCPTENDLQKVLQRTRRLGFPGMIGSIDCCKLMWKNCPVGWRGQYQGKEKKPALTLEVIADDRLYIWHAFFGTPGSANDLSVLEASPLLNKIADGSFPPKVSYTVNGKERDVPYFLCDGVYPKYPILVHTVQEPVTKKEKNLAVCQEGRRKDVESAFGVLQGRWHILQRPSRFWYVSNMRNIMYCCIVLHNMMVEEGLTDEEETWTATALNRFSGAEIVHSGTPVWANEGEPEVVSGSIAALCRGQEFLRDEYKQAYLQNDVMDHLWSLLGTS